MCNTSCSANTKCWCARTVLIENQASTLNAHPQNRFMIQFGRNHLHETQVADSTLSDHRGILVRVFSHVVQLSNRIFEHNASHFCTLHSSSAASRTGTLNFTCHVVLVVFDSDELAQLLDAVER